LIEAPITLLADRWSRQLVLASALGGLALALALCALADVAWLLACALALAGAASGVACGVAQGELVSTFPGGPQRAMSRWVAFAAAGDAVSPLLVATALWSGSSYRTALGALALLTAVQAWWAMRTHSERPALQVAAVDDEDAPAPPLLAAVRASVRQPRLWVLLTATSLCLLLDETLVAFAALRLHEDRGWSEDAVAAVMTALAIGGMLGALASERLLARFMPRTLMIASALGSAAFLGLFIVSEAPAVATVALLLLGLFGAAHYPLLKAAAYELAPGRPGLVNALTQVFVVVEITLPLALGALAASEGLTITLAALALQPLGVLIAALTTNRTSRA
jgi:predicted MFS family arabinose efflux permease